jgi:hypothetical protein
LSIEQVYFTERGPGVQVCWNCRGKPYHVIGHNLADFDPGDTVVQIGKGAGSFRIAKRDRGGVDVLESVTTGNRHEMNNGNNRLYIPESAMGELVALRRRVGAANVQAARFAQELRERNDRAEAHKEEA